MDTANILFVASKGGGKSTTMMAILKKCKAVLAMTTKQEAEGDFLSPLYKQAYSVDEAKELIAKHWPNFHICLRIECEPEDISGPCQMAEDMIKGLYDIRRGKYGKFTQDGQEITIAVDEAHRTFPQHAPIKLPYLSWLMTEARVSGIHVLVATQYPTQIPVKIRNSIDTWYVGYCGDNALKSIKERFKNHENIKKHVYRLYHLGEFVDQGDTRKPTIIQQPA